MKKTIFLIAAVAAFLGAKAQVRSYYTDPGHPVDGSSVPFGGERLVNDTLKGYSWTNGAAVGPTVLAASGGGYVCGNNKYGDKQKAQVFSNSIVNLLVEGALIWFPVKQSDNGSSAGSKIMVKEYSLNGNGMSNSGFITNAPGTVNATTDVLFSAVDTGSTFASGVNTVLFSSPVAVTGNFAIGVDFTALTVGDTVGIVCSTPGDAAGNDQSWEQQSDNTWHSFLQSWPLDVDLFIWALVDNTAGLGEQQFVNGLRMEGYFPNPAAECTNVHYALENSADLSLAIFDANGKLVLSKELGKQPAGKGGILLETEQLDNGIYYCALTAGKARLASKLIISR